VKRIVEDQAMANQEKITCDYAGCSEPFAYRIKGFNLCSKHLFEGEESSLGERLRKIEQIAKARA
jgi:hypothetical protein